MKFEDSVALGREYEIAVSKFLQRRGWSVLPAYDYSGKGDSKAPRLMNMEGGLVVPDLLACRNGKTRWFEVKWKTRADFTRMTQRMETGVDGRLYQHYRQVKHQSGQQVWIVFVHIEEQQVRANEIGELDKIVRYSPNFNNGKGGFFFPWDGIPLVATYDEVTRENAYFVTHGEAA